MDRLPKEIFSSIVSFLEMSDKLICISVCRDWYNAISNTNLYRTVKIDDDVERLNKAFALFTDNEHFGRQVTHLDLHDCYPHMFITLSLPRLLPNIKFLKWDNWLTTNTQNTDTPPKQICDLAFKNWNKLEDIIVRMKVTDFPMVVYLLGSSNFLYLTRLNIEISPANRTFDEIFIKQRLGKELIGYLKNAPTLAYLRLGYAAIDFEDMELLHANAPNLQHLDLSNTNISHSNHNCSISSDRRRLVDNAGNDIVKKPASGLQVMSLGIEAYTLSAWTNADFQQIVSMWILYISQKYVDVEQLVIGRNAHGYDYMPSSIQSFEQPLVNSILNMKQLQSYDVNVYPLSKNILEALETNNFKLRSLNVYIDHLTYEDQLVALKSFRGRESIEELNIFPTMAPENIHGIDEKTLGVLLTDQCKEMANLKTLKINSLPELESYNTQLLVDILAGLPPNISKLHFGTLDLYSATYDYTMEGTEPCQLNSLSIDTGFVDALDNHLYVNSYLEFILKLCPLLERFEIIGDIKGSRYDQTAPTIILDFSHHKQLKSINIRLQGVSCYKLNTPDKKDRKWIDFNTPYRKDILAEDDKKFSLKLTWLENTVTSITLLPGHVSWMNVKWNLLTE